jgi:hypothetical protein
VGGVGTGGGMTALSSLGGGALNLVSINTDTTAAIATADTPAMISHDISGCGVGGSGGEGGEHCGSFMA